MPPKGSGNGRVRGAPQLSARVSLAEKARVKAWLEETKQTEAEVIRRGLNLLNPGLRLT